MGNLTIEQFRHKILIKLLCRKANLVNQFDYQKLLKQVAYFANDILRSEGITDAWAKLCRERIFIIYRPTQRIVCELKLTGERAENLISKPDVVLFNLRGKIEESLTIEKIIADTVALGERRRKNGK